MQPRFVIGIDLGTTNSAMGLRGGTGGCRSVRARRRAIDGDSALANPSELRDEDLLPSFLYLPGATVSRPEPSPCPGTRPAGSWSAGWRTSAARRMPGGWYPRPSRGFRTPAWTARPRCCRSALPKAWRRSRLLKPPAATWSTCGMPGMPRCRTPRSPRSRL